jgi:hypothetical protein
MANIRKSFNFNAGLQVDNNKFVVTPAGQVGIGTSSPQAFKLLDVHGGVRILGLATITTLEVAGVSTFYDDLKVGSAITLDASAGTINATNVVANSFNGGVIVAIATAGWTFENGGTGISTFISVGIGTTSDTDYDLTIGSGISFTGNSGSAFYSGIVTATTFDGDLDAAHLTAGTIPDARFPATLPAASGASLTSLNASNISSGTINAARVPTLNQNTTGTAAGLSGSPNTVLGVTTTGVLTAGNLTAGTITGTSLTAGTIAGTGLSVTSIGIGTATPANTFQQRATGATELQITSDTASASITVGREPGTSNTNNAEFRYGGGSGFPYSNAQSLDIVNYGTGNFNYYLSANNAGAAAGDYVWHKGSNNDQLMALTKDGNLGIGITNPTHKLNVQGISTFTGNAYFNSDVTINGNLSATFVGDVKNSSNSVILDVSKAQLNGNVNTTSGVSTFKDVELSGRIGIGITASSNPVSVNELTVDRFMVDSNGKVGVRTDSINTNMELDVNGDIQARHGLVVGPTTAPKCAIDMSGVVDIVADGSSRAPIAYMIPPRLTTAQRNALTDTAGNALSSDEAGATIYNISTNKLQVWNGSSWNDCF